MRRYRRGNRYKKVIIFSFVFLICVISIGYAAFETNLHITAKGNIREKSRTIQSYSTGNENFHSDFYKKILLV